MLHKQHFYDLLSSIAHTRSGAEFAKNGISALLISYSKFLKILPGDKDILQACRWSPGKVEVKHIALVQIANTFLTGRSQGSMELLFKIHLMVENSEFAW
jgi:hypothetical protein